MLQDEKSGSGRLFLAEQCKQGILLAVTHFTEAIQQLALGNAELLLVDLADVADAQAHGQNGEVMQALFESRDNFRVHAAVVLTRNLGDVITHSIRQAYDELVCCTTGKLSGGCFHNQGCILEIGGRCSSCWYNNLVVTTAISLSMLPYSRGKSNNCTKLYSCFTILGRLDVLWWLNGVVFVSPFVSWFTLDVPCVVVNVMSNSCFAAEVTWNSPVFLYNAQAFVSPDQHLFALVAQLDRATAS